MANNRKTGSRRREVAVGKYGEEVEGEEKEERSGKPEAKEAEKVKKGNRGQDGKENWRASQPRTRWKHNERAAKNLFTLLVSTHSLLSSLPGKN